MIHLDLSKYDLSLTDFKEQVEAFTNIKKQHNKQAVLFAQFDTFSDFITGLTSLNETRFYCFNNMYLNGIQAGIQSAHGLAELSNKYFLNNKNFNTGDNSFFKKNIFDEPDLSNHNYSYPEHLITQLKKCFKQDKTVVILNGGDHASLENLYKDFLDLHYHIHLPVALFKESEGALNGASTNIATCISESSFNREFKSLSKEIFSQDDFNLSDFNFSNLRHLLSSEALNLNSFISKSFIDFSDDELSGYILNAKKVLNFEDILFYPIKDKIYLITKYDLLLSNMLNRFRLFS